MAELDLTFSDWQEKIKNSLGTTEWIIVSSMLATYDDINNGMFFSALIPNTQVKHVLKNYSWDVRIGSNLPCYSAYVKDGKEIKRYYRFSSDNGIEPLVYWRDFHGIKEDYYEISEEFRLYFNLFEERKSLQKSRFIYIDSNGDEHEAVLVSQNEVKIKLRFLKEFLAARKMHLAIYFSFKRFSEKSLNELEQEEINNVIRGEKYIFSNFVSNLGSGKKKSQGQLLGKKLIAGPRNYKPNIFGSIEEKKYESFVVGIDEDGKEILHTCEEEKLANFFGKNPGSPQFLTPVYFKKEVLKKYYDNPKKYSVDDGYLCCGGLWGLNIDNNHPKYIMVFLGDLGHLHQKEQMYWKSFNVSDRGGISRVAWERNFESKFTDPEQPDLYFKYRLDIFQKAWFEKYGWYLFKPLLEADSHHIKSLHIPTMNDQKGFDEQVLSLTKIIIGSLNEKELAKGISIEKKNPQGIDKFEAFLSSKNLHFKGMLEFIRNLQSLRSTSVAHRKSDRNKDYLKVKDYFDFENKNNREIFEGILIKIIWMFNSLEEHLLGEQMKKYGISP